MQTVGNAARWQRFIAQPREVACEPTAYMLPVFSLRGKRCTLQEPRVAGVGWEWECVSEWECRFSVIGENQELQEPCRLC